MKHQEWKRVLKEIADEFGAELVDTGRRFLIRCSNGAPVWCSKTPSHPARDQVRKQVKRATNSQPRSYAT